MDNEDATYADMSVLMCLLFSTRHDDTDGRVNTDYSFRRHSRFKQILRFHSLFFKIVSDKIKLLYCTSESLNVNQEIQIKKGGSYYMDNWEAIRLDLGMIAGFLYGGLGSIWAVPYLLIIKPIIDFFKKLFQ